MKKLMNKAMARAEFLLHIFQEHGILLLAGRSKDETYKDETILMHLSVFLGESGEKYVEFDHKLSDFHTKGRRSRQVKVIMRRNLPARDFVEVIPGDDLKKFEFTLSPEKRMELRKFFGQQVPMLMTVAEGDENNQLHELLSNQPDSTGHQLRLFRPPVINLFKTGHSRNNLVPTAFVYMVK